MKHGSLWTFGAVAAVAAVGVLLVPAGAWAQCCPGPSKTPVAVKAWTAEEAEAPVKACTKCETTPTAKCAATCGAKAAGPAKACSKCETAAGAKCAATCGAKAVAGNGGKACPKCLTAAGTRCAATCGAKAAAGCPVKGLSAALKAIDKALAAVKSGDSEVATAQLLTARKLVGTQHAAAAQRTKAAKPAKIAAAPVKPVGPKAATGVYANTRCPIMGGPVKASGGSAVYDGKKVGFCCPGCITAWSRLTDKEKAAKLAKSK
jgi:hypothetical protein